MKLPVESLGAKLASLPEGVTLYDRTADTVTVDEIERIVI